MCALASRTGTSAIRHNGQLPARASMTSGCIGHVIDIGGSAGACGAPPRAAAGARWADSVAVSTSVTHPMISAARISTDCAPFRRRGQAGCAARSRRVAGVNRNGFFCILCGIRTVGLSPASTKLSVPPAPKAVRG
jgi:hypothetical protein